MNPEKTTIFYGPPGTGKTTALIGKVEAMLCSGLYQPEEIAYFTFTRGAAEVALARAMRARKATADKFPLFKTLHSMASHLTPKVGTFMLDMDWRAVAKECGLTCEKWLRSRTNRAIRADEGKGDIIFGILEACRHNGMSHEEALAQIPHVQIRPSDLEYVAAKVAEFKRVYGKRDFTDLIEAYVKEGWWPRGLRVMIVDEAQDLSILQWAMVRKLAERCEHVYIAGDDDQSIYRWAGASPETFIALEGHREFLSTTYRVRWGAHRLAELVTGQIKNRQPKVWNPIVGTEEDLFRAQNLASLEFKKGHWLILCRAQSIADKVVERLNAMGVQARGRHIDIDEPAKLQLALRAWHRLRTGASIRASSAKALYSFAVGMYGRKGFRLNLMALPDDELVNHDRLRTEFGWRGGMNLQWYQVFRSCMSRSEEQRRFIMDTQQQIEEGTLVVDNTVEVSTIHAAKGDERDNVVVLTDIPFRIRAAILTANQDTLDDEWRVWYVAVTRAKQRLFLMSPQFGKHSFHEINNLLHYVTSPIPPSVPLSHHADGPSGEESPSELEDAELRLPVGNGTGEE